MADHQTVNILPGYPSSFPASFFFFNSFLSLVISASFSTFAFASPYIFLLSSLFQCLFYLSFRLFLLTFAHHFLFLCSIVFNRTFLLFSFLLSPVRFTFVSLLFSPHSFLQSLCFLFTFLSPFYFRLSFFSLYFFNFFPPLSHFLLPPINFFLLVTSKLSHVLIILIHFSSISWLSLPPFPASFFL